MIRFSTTTRSLARVRGRIGGIVADGADDAIKEIRFAWVNELRRQQQEFAKDGTWEPLSPLYLKRKQADRTTVYPDDILRKTGSMIGGYISEIEEDRTDKVIGIVFPDDKDGVKAKAHQGITGRPRGMPARRFDTGRFREIAYDTFQRQITKKINER